MRKLFLILVLASPAFAGVRPNWLLSGPDARAVALGDAFVAGATGSEAVFWNPSRLMASPGHDAMLQYAHPEMFTNRGWMTARYGGRSVKLGLGGKWESPGRVNNKSSMKQAYYFSFAMPFPVVWTKYPISIGTSLGVLNMRILDSRASSVFVNFGLSAQVHRDVQAGLAIDNLYFSGLKYTPSYKERYPVLARFGLAWNPQRILRGGLTFLANGAMSSDLFQGGLGVQFSPMPFFALRMGMSQMPRFGIGISPLGNKMSFDFGYKLGGATSDQMAASFVYRWGLPQKQKDVDDPWAIARGTHKGLVENMRIRLQDATKYGTKDLDILHVARLLAVEPTATDAWMLLGVKMGDRMPQKPSAGVPRNKKEALMYLSFAHAYARDQMAEARIRGEEYMSAYPETELSPLVGFLLSLVP